MLSTLGQAIPSSDPIAILSGAPGALDPALVLLLALILDALIGDPRWLWAVLPHPVTLVGGLISSTAPGAAR